ncbi:L-cystine-binding protein FliY [Candidatus Rhabdochlamydia oedothoracis]|uniref:L-cystine-binding protein FliY n=1 Tax=Candidatus Rhabdochlamydia oedothoracis TaxID=2720720 RepID=A0ABX8V017_9BACT|nr:MULTISPECIES: transporter substrate-binding domain-containing protein [Rhabdochlamydia]KAG6558930.1 L-cystine-binding protein FliY [Candidatus Rhabdochlamydia sp. W815]MCL6755863.1 transporter substrate-binding domain-containing protein [Candidatus Rhabdochlamydia oedothoracis]QYF48226.1 L-cystine-binding protein FliY [Candidatus Rhabdochlamydia oedothoracis]
MLRKISTLLLLALLCCCGSKNHQQRVALDPSWYPLDLEDKNAQLVGFSTEILQKISEKLPLAKIITDAHYLLEDLFQGKYEAVLSSFPPYNFNKDRFDFSESYLMLGPVIVVNKSSDISSIKQLKGKAIGVLSDANALLVELVPNVLIHQYTSKAQALEDITSGVLDAALIDILSAYAYCEDLYQDKLKVGSLPLTNEALRLITARDKNGSLIKAFNKEIHRLKQSGEYQKIIDKWGLPQKEIKK